MTTKMTYGEQLKHPNWQRKRLEVLERACFKCECCESAEKTLHVHHKRYIKGRQAWEYEAEELESLCEDCHEDAHKAKDRINNLLSLLPSACWDEVADLINGWASTNFDVDEDECASASAYLRGRIAAAFVDLDVEGLSDIRDWWSVLGPDRFVPALDDGGFRSEGYPR